MLVSVVVPTYNAEKFLEETLRSIQSQTLTDFEVLVVDDGSSDDTKGVVEKFHKEDNRFSFFGLEHQGAPGHSRNEGLRLAKGDYVVFFDSDDSMEPTMLEDLVAQMDESTDLVIGNARYFDVVRNCECASGNEEFFASDTHSYNDLFTINPFPCNKMYRRQFLLDSNVWYLERVFNQDLGYFLCLIMHRPKFKVLNKIIMEYHIRPNSITTNKKTIKRHIDILKVFDQVFEEFSKFGSKDMEYGLYQMFIKTMVFKISFFDIEQHLDEIKLVRNYLYEHAPNWYRTEEYTSYFSLKKKLYHVALIRMQLYGIIRKYKQLKRGR